MKLYKYIFTATLLAMVGAPLVLTAQNKPEGILGAATAVTPPSAYAATRINYVRTWEPNAALKDTTEVQSSVRTAREVKQATQYLDGLGRVMQTVAKGVSGNGRDLVSIKVYDPFGREQYSYLPYVQQASANGKFKTDPFNAQNSFYKNGVLNPGVVGENIFYSRIEYEASSLNRPIKTFAPGNSWGNRPIELLYKMNEDVDSVRIWNIGAALPVSTGNYKAGELYKEVSVDENGNQYVEYTDKDAKVILKKIQISDAPSMGAYGWLCTYYIYDDLDNLCYVIPPAGVEAIKSNNWTVTTAVDTGLCFQYQYDARQRMTMKRVPGAGRVLMIYDKRDRLVFSQDSIQRAKLPMEWLVIFYDELNRPSMTGIYKNITSADSLQKSMNIANTSQSVSYVIPAKADLSVYQYDDSNITYSATNSVSLVDGFDSGVEANFVVEINRSLAGDTTTFVASNPLPNIPASALIPLTYTFYDNYDYAGKLAFSGIDTVKLLAADTLYPERRPVTNATKGLVTGTKVSVLGTDKWLTTTNYYNDKGRIVQIASENNVGGKDITSTLYSFNGSILAMYTRHQNPQSNTVQTTILTTITYDHAGRQQTIRKRLNDDVSQERIVTSNSYDELGRLRLKRLGVTSSGSMLDTLNYTYNIRGWLQGINKSFVNSGNITSNWFGQELSYDYGFKINQYNGNVSGVKWKTRADSAWAYGYTYDRNNRLLSAYFTQRNGNAWAQGTKDFSVDNLSYDANGNIKTMLQKGLIGTTSKTIDSLIYTYPSNSNRLLGVRDIDSSVTRLAQLGDFIDGNTATKDYYYDVNGNMVSDLNKRISSIAYNHLNLPSVITVTGKGTIAYQYDAAGNKLSKTVIDNTGSSTKKTIIDYVGPFIYKQDSLELISHEEGRIRPVYKTGAPLTYAYDYFEKDHLGNVRTVLTDQTDFTMYAATMESAAAEKELVLFNNVAETRTEKPTGYPQDELTPENKFVAKLNAKSGGRKIGPSLVLRVMGGDTVKISARAFYKSQGPQMDEYIVPVEDMVAGLVQVFSSAAQGNDSHRSGLSLSNVPFNENFYSNDYQRLKERDNDANYTQRPNAYLSFVLFDDDFKMVEDNSGVKQVNSSPDELQELGVESMAIKKTGFLYVYTSNESQQDVYFDNIILGLSSGPLLEETHYYPFGLAMTGISGKNIGKLENRYKFNGIENNNDFDLNQYETFYRTLDPQIGRFLQIDPKSIQTEGVYNAMGNNPVSNVDWLGDYFTWANTGLQDMYKQMREENSRRMKGYISELATLDLNSQNGDVQERISQLNGLINSHKDLVGQWDKMEESGVEFYVTDQGAIDGSHGATQFNPEKNRINIAFAKNGVNMTTMAHEFRHGYGYLVGELVGTVGADPFYDAMDEVVAHNAGYLFLGPNTVKDVSEGKFNLEWFKTSSIGKNPLYSKLVGRDKQLTVNSTVANFKKYNPDSRIAFVLGFKNNANMTLLEAIEFLNKTSQKSSGRPEIFTGETLKNR